MECKRECRMVDRMVGRMVGRMMGRFCGSEKPHCISMRPVLQQASDTHSGSPANLLAYVMGYFLA